MIGGNVILAIIKSAVYLLASLLLLIVSIVLLVVFVKAYRKYKKMCD